MILLVWTGLPFCKLIVVAFPIGKSKTVVFSRKIISSFVCASADNSVCLDFDMFIAALHHNFGTLLFIEI
jgi:hypothetical protein